MYKYLSARAKSAELKETRESHDYESLPIWPNPIQDEIQSNASLCSNQSCNNSGEDEKSSGDQSFSEEESDNLSSKNKFTRKKKKQPKKVKKWLRPVFKISLPVKDLLPCSEPGCSKKFTVTYQLENHIRAVHKGLKLIILKKKAKNRVLICVSFYF